MKKFVKVLGVVAALLVVILLIVSLSLGTIIEKAVRNVGPKVTGVPVTVENVDFNVFSGKAGVDNLVVGNPSGFNTAHAFKLGTFILDIDVGSILSDKILIRKILIDGPEITYELGLKGTNLKKLQAQIAEKSGAKPVGEEPGEAPAEEPEPEKRGKKVEIAELVISGGRVNLNATALGGSEVPIPLPTLRLTDIGKEKEGASVAQVIEDVLAAVLEAATGTVKGSGKLLGKGLTATGDIAEKGAKLGGDAVLKGADAAGAAAKKLGGSLGSESKKILGGLKGQLKRAGE